MSSDSNIWYRVGYALERGRGREAPSKGGNGARAPRRHEEEGDDGLIDLWPSADDLIATGIAALAGRVLSAWKPARKVTFSRLLRAGLAGAGAAVLVELVRPLLSGRAELPSLGSDTGAKMISGMSQGLLYGAVVEPRVPGPPLFKGAVFALAEYLADPAGGLSHLLGAHTPHGSLPVVGDLLTDMEPEEREYLEHLAFGVALALLCGTGPSVSELVED